MNETETRELVPQEPGRFDLAHTDGVAALKQAETMVKYLAAKCDNAQFIAHISGKKYPKVEWWTTVGAGFGLFPVEESCTRLDRDEETAYEAVVSVKRSGEIVSRGSAMCSSKENRWRGRDEYAIRSMAVTRATGKAYRIAFSFLAVMAGLEGTPAEEIPEEQKAPPPRNATPHPDPDRQLVIDQIGEVVKDRYFTPEDRTRYRARVKAAGDVTELRRVLEQAIAERATLQSEVPQAPADPVAEEAWEQTEMKP